MSSLKHQTISGIKWVFAASVAQRVIAFGTTVVLARVLTPADFGLFALAFVMIDGFSLFKSLGFDSALVRRKEGDIAVACDTAFFLIPLTGITLFIVLFFAAPFGARALGNAQVTNIIRALGLVFVISCFGKVPQMVLYRAMKFKAKTLAEFSGHAAYAVTALLLALNGFGVWSLVAAYLLRNFIQISIEWVVSGWKPRWRFDKAVAWDMFHFGKYIFAGGVLWFFNNNLDNIVVGKYLGVEMLGYYAIAFNLANFVATYFLGRVGLVLYPAYSKIQDDPGDVLRVMLKSVKMVSVIIFPFAFGVFIFAPDILALLLGEKWLPAAGALRVLVWVGLFRSLGGVMWPVFMAKGKTKADFLVNLASVGVFFALVIPLSLKFKLIGAATAVLISAVTAFVIGVIRIRAYFHLRAAEFLSALKMPFYCSLMMGLAGVAAEYVTVSFGPKLSAISAMGIATVTYLAVSHLWDRNLFAEIKESLLSRPPARTDERASPLMGEACPP